VTEPAPRVLATGLDALLLVLRLLELHARLVERVLADCHATAFDAAPLGEPDEIAAELRSLLQPTVH